MKPQSFIFMGRYGSGKGTQSELLMKRLKEIDPAHGIIYAQTGAEFRKFFNSQTYTAALSKKIVESGVLMPEFMCVYLWTKLISENYTGSEHFVFDGTPRKLMEAHMLNSVFEFYSLEKPWLIYLDVDHEESHKRLTIRARSSGRADDGQEQIETRRLAYQNDVVPTIEFYRTYPGVNFLDIDGERSVEEIHEDIVKRVGLK